MVMVMPAASAPTVMMATTSTPHMAVAVAMATAHQNGIDAGLRSDGSQRRHRHRRGRQRGHYRQYAKSRGSDQQKTIHLTFLSMAAVARRTAMSLSPGSSVQGTIDLSVDCRTRHRLTISSPRIGAAIDLPQCGMDEIVV
jgi:hypothetical protein